MSSTNIKIIMIRKTEHPEGSHMRISFQMHKTDENAMCLNFSIRINSFDTFMHVLLK